MDAEFILAALRDSKTLSNQAELERFIHLVDIYTQTFQQPDLVELLRLFSDDCNYPLGLDHLLGILLKMDSRAFATALISAFPTLTNTAPEWLSILLARTLDDHEKRQQFIIGIKTADDSTTSRILEFSNIMLTNNALWGDDYHSELVEQVNELKMVLT